MRLKGLLMIFLILSFAGRLPAQDYRADLMRLRSAWTQYQIKTDEEIDLWKSAYQWSTNERTRLVDESAKAEKDTASRYRWLMVEKVLYQVTVLIFVSLAIYGLTK
jgi:hypothetical protein